MLLSSCGFIFGKTRPEGKIRIACYSRNYARIAGGHASGALINDPMIVMQPIPVIGKYALGHGITAEEIRRAGRIYYPRVYEQFLENDVTIFQEAPLNVEGFTNFDGRFLLWCKQYAIEGGGSLDMYGGDASFGAGLGAYYPSWEDTPVAEVLPVDIIPGGVRGLVSRGGTWCVAGTGTMVEFPEDTIGLARLPWNTAPKPNFDEPLNAVLFRQGATKIAEAVHGEDRYPLVAYWEIGEGSSLAYTVVFASGGTGRMLQWKWYPDFVTYLMYHSAGVPMPENIYLPHVIRENIQVYESEKVFAYSYLDFISKLGGNTLEIEQFIGEITEIKDEADDLYLQGRFEESRDTLKEAVEEMNNALEAAKKLEGSVMLWIYVIEWFTVVGTLMLSGVVLNFLMVRRRLYKEVVTTRAR